MSHVYCSECGFQNSEAANFCARCGALLEREGTDAETTLSYTPEHLTEDVDNPTETISLEDIEEEGGDLDELGVEGPALVVRSGGGRAGEHFTLERTQTTIGRTPDCDIFLDDVTVSRSHAVLLQQDGSFQIEDLGSLNGTFLNRKRIESVETLENGDELQIGKYRLTFLDK